MVYVKQGSKRVNTRVFRAKTKKIDKYSRRRIDQREATATLLSFLEFTVQILFVTVSCISRRSLSRKAYKKAQPCLI